MVRSIAQRCVSNHAALGDDHAIQPRLRTARSRAGALDWPRRDRRHRGDPDAGARARRCGPRRSACAYSARARQSLVHPRGSRAAVVGRGRRDRQEPEPEFRRPHEGDRSRARSAARPAETDQGARSPRGRGRPGRRRVRWHAAVYGAELGAVGCADRSRRRRLHDHRRTGARHPGQRFGARLQRPGARADHRTQGRARPPHRYRRSALASASSGSSRRSPIASTIRASAASAHRSSSAATARRSISAPC